MYCDYFGFGSDPFSIAPDPAFLYPSPAHRQALAHLKYGIEREGGVMLLTGEVGTGKTTLCRLLIEQIPANTRVAYILHTQLDAVDVLASICEELAIDVAGDKAKAKSYIDALNADLLRAHAEGRKTLVIIEEAQNLAPEVLEMLRLLTNLETNTCKLLHILLVGQPELLDLIHRPELRQLNQRVISRFHLEGLSAAELHNYVNYRLSKAGFQGTLFNGGALRELYRRSGGIPRLINLIAERALLGAYAQERRQVGARLVRDAAAEVTGKPGSISPRVGRWILATVVVVVFLAGLGMTLSRNWSWHSAAERVSAVPASSSTSASNLQPEGSPAQKLLALWGVKTAGDPGTNLCVDAPIHQLRCEHQGNLTLDDLRLINRPGLVSLEGTTQVLTGLGSTQVNLWHDGTESSMSRADFSARWDGQYEFVWRAPTGYQHELKPGDTNWPLVDWLQSQLDQQLPGRDRIISAGNYSQPLVAQVQKFQQAQKIDENGVLGTQTLMRLNELNGKVPTLLQKSGGN